MFSVLGLVFFRVHVMVCIQECSLLWNSVDASRRVTLSDMSADSHSLHTHLISPLPRP